MGRLIAKKVAGQITKAVAADQIRQKNEALGNLAWIVMNVADQADLRQWSTMPETIQVARLRLKPGTYTVKIQGLTSREGGGPSGENHVVQKLVVKPNKKTFINWRSVR